MKTLVLALALLFTVDAATARERLFVGVHTPAQTRAYNAWADALQCERSKGGGGPDLPCKGGAAAERELKRLGCRLAFSTTWSCPRR